jgi:cardiolipin synthase A/B
MLAGWSRSASLALLAVVLAGCGSLPRITPEMARGTGVRPRLEGARGPLTAVQSKAVLDRLRGTGQGSGIIDRHLALEEAVVGSPLTIGNDVVLLQDGAATYTAMFAAIGAARDHINMESYILEDDDVGRRFADALIARQRAGVQVNLIHDGVGTLGTPDAFFQRLTNAGVKVLTYNPVNPFAARAGWDINQRDHRKLLIVDGRVAFLGGINISSVYSGGSLGTALGSRSRAVADGVAASAKEAGKLAWRDTDVQLRGPVVAEFQKLFLDTWSGQKGEPLPDRDYFPTPETAGNQVVRAIGSAPGDPFSLIYVTLISALDNAESSVMLTNAYFVPDPQLLASLERAAKRGVDVRLILPSRTDSWLVFQAGRRSYEALLLAGVKIYERRGVILHSKTALIDGVWATVGSTNLDWRSFLHNQELNAVVLGAEFGAQVQAMFDKDLMQSDPVTLEQWQRRGAALRLKEWFAGVWEYWL